MMIPPALTPLFTFMPRATIWLWFKCVPIGAARFDPALNLQSASNGLIVIGATCAIFSGASLNTALDLKTASDCLVVLHTITSRFDAALNLQTSSCGLVVLHAPT